MSTTTLTIDDNLLEEAKTAGKRESEEEVVTEALQEYIARRKQLQIINLFGTIDYDPEYDYKAQRRVQ
jgi:metal-responsive CopG/Arc/MetJ family transcriptional regulator